MTDPVALGIGVTLVAIGLVLFVLELVHPGVFLLIPASILLAAGVLALFAEPLLLTTVWGPAVVVTVAVGAAFATIPYYRWVAPTHKPMSTTSDSLTGEVGIVIAPIVPDTIRGKVRINSEVWSARADRPIPEGTKVRVLRGEGVSVTVQPLDGYGAQN
ncbi:MAG: NfeD family protein [Thermoplasmata archaeon]|nr:NfeD family protein [Thermoplasmata archaeon]